MSIWTTLFSGQTVLSGVIGVVASVGAFTYQYNQDSFEAAVSEASVVTALREQLVSQQRQLDAAERRHAASVLDVKKEQEKLRLEALVQGSEQNRVMMGLLEKWLDELSKRVEDLPTLVGGGIDPVALKRAVDQAKADVSSELERRLADMPVSSSSGGVTLAQVEGLIRRVEGQIVAGLDPLIEERLAALAAATGDGIPIATKRRTHFAEEECLFMPSFEDERFTIRSKRGTEFCFKESQLYMIVTKVGSETVTFEWPKFGSSTCYKHNFQGDSCILAGYQVLIASF